MNPWSNLDPPETSPLRALMVANEREVKCNQRLGHREQVLEFNNFTAWVVREVVVKSPFDEVDHKEWYCHADNHAGNVKLGIQKVSLRHFKSATETDLHASLFEASANEKKEHDAKYSCHCDCDFNLEPVVVLRKLCAVRQALVNFGKHLLADQGH
jgi:hypothetical protein